MKKYYILQVVCEYDSLVQLMFFFLMNWIRFGADVTEMVCSGQFFI